MVANADSVVESDLANMMNREVSSGSIEHSKERIIEMRWRNRQKQDHVGPSELRSESFTLL